MTGYFNDQGCTCCLECSDKVINKQHQVVPCANRGQCVAYQNHYEAECLRRKVVKEAKRQYSELFYPPATQGSRRFR